MPDSAVPALDRTAVIGLGNLGGAMVAALVDAGRPVTVWDKDPAAVARCEQFGARSAGGPRDLADHDVVAIVVTDDTAVREVLVDSGLLAALPATAVVALHSTVLPATAQDLGRLAAENGLSFVDAPVSGGADRARTGELTVIVGAGEASLSRARAYLDVIGSDVVHAGPPGAGAAAKLANQLMMFAALAGTHEAIKLTQAYGVGTEALLDAVATSTGDCWVARNWGFFDRVTADYNASGVPLETRPWSKDLWDVVAAARQVATPLPVAGLLAQVMADMVERHAGTRQP
jgi:3-hydroxyisobutyrate dehydrogenase